MKSPDKIKKGLEHCVKLTVCTDCPYSEDCNCDDELFMDALAYIQQLEAMQYAVKDAISSIVFYDGHAGWLLHLADALEKTDGVVGCPFDVSQWHSEKHVIWMILAGMFGDWGTSIRGAWIEKNKEAAKFIRELCDNGDEEPDAVESNEQADK